MMTLLLSVHVGPALKTVEHLLRNENCENFFERWLLFGISEELSLTAFSERSAENHKTPLHCWLPLYAPCLVSVHELDQGDCGHLAQKGKDHVFIADFKRLVICKHEKYDCALARAIHLSYSRRS